MIDLAPSHKTGLPLASPLIAGGGAFGFADEYASLVDFSRLGAFVTNPLTLRPRTPAQGTRVVPFPGGVLVHTGLPNPGLSAALRDYERKWTRLGCPVIVHLAADTVSDLINCVDKLERVDSVAGIEIGFRDDEPLTNAEALLRAAAQTARQPVIAGLPHARAAAFARMAEKAGAQALTVTAPPRGTLWREGNWVTGRLYGPTLLPRALALVRELKTQTALPIIGAGGVHSRADMDAMLEAGATAVQIDSVVWVEPKTLTTDETDFNG
ncbi:MAG: nitronate monooxygenase [Chloroflexi bacterium]|nr:nitronate monooxygenase [Chloroflexota bacterium]